MTADATTRAIVFACAALCACNSNEGAGSAGCPADVPSTCPAPAPSYSTQVAPLITKYCAVGGCHVPGGTAADQPLSTYNDLFQRRSEALDQIYECRMPLEPPDPTTTERVTLLGWFVCGAPNN